MAAWVVTEGDKAVWFICGPCAVEFYNAGRHTRSEPKEGDPPSGATLRDCPRDKSNGGA